MNEVSKIGQPDEEPIEGKIVPDYAGPGFNAWDYINAAVLDMYRRDSPNYYKANRVYVAPVDDPTDWTEVGTAGSVTYERGPSFPTSVWFDEAADFRFEDTTVETTIEDVDPEMFKLLTGYDYEVLRVTQTSPWDKPVPPVDPDKVRWPHAR